MKGNKKRKNSRRCIFSIRPSMLGVDKWRWSYALPRRTPSHQIWTVCITLFEVLFRDFALPQSAQWVCVCVCFFSSIKLRSSFNETWRSKATKRRRKKVIAKPPKVFFGLRKPFLPRNKFSVVIIRMARRKNPYVFSYRLLFWPKQSDRPQLLHTHTHTQWWTVWGDMVSGTCYMVNFWRQTQGLHPQNNIVIK